MMTGIRGILFDLDGTLLDTLPDLLLALNFLRADRGLKPLPPEKIRPIANLGSKAMVKEALGMEENHPEIMSLREKFIAFYEVHLADTTRFFPNMEAVLDHLDKKSIPWGIVTNKLTRHGTPLLKALKFDHRPRCVVYGDTLSKAKPDPAPLLHACEKMQIAPQECVFVGDAVTDILASKAAGTQSLAALYGYIDTNADPYQWHADGYIKDPLDIIDWLQK